MSNDHAYELRELMLNWLKSMETLGERARESLASFTPPAAEPDRFKHTDDHGDSVAVAVTPVSGSVLELDTSTTAEIYLDQGAVNRLAQYLDRHRTDTPCPSRFHDTDCAGMRGYAGECDDNADAIGASDPKEHWCGSDSDHAEHVSKAQGVPLRCLGAYAGRYGLSPGVLPGSVNVRGNCLACGHHAHGVVGCAVGSPGSDGRCLCRGGSDGA